MKKLFMALVVLMMFQCRSVKHQKYQTSALDGSQVSEQLPDTNSDSDLQLYDKNNCLMGQDLNQPKVDISKCPVVPSYPEDAYGYSLGAWELGQTKEGEIYKYGNLSGVDENPRRLEFSGGETVVDQISLNCWAAGYYRLRHYLKNPPAEYLKLKENGFQSRFFQFQTDLRNGPTGYQKSSAYQDHLVKWVTFVKANGECVEPTRKDFEDFAKSEVLRRSL